MTAKPEYWPNLGLALRTVRDELNVWRTQRANRTDQKAPLVIVASGFRLRYGTQRRVWSWPVCVELGNQNGSQPFAVEPLLLRRRDWPRGSRLAIFDYPHGHVTRDRLTTTADDLALLPHGDSLAEAHAAVAALGHVVREVSTRKPTVVGADLMSVVVPRPFRHRLLVQYHPSAATLAQLASDGAPVPILTPWCVNSKGAMAPTQATVTGMRTWLGPCEVEFVGHPRQPMPPGSPAPPEIITMQPRKQWRG